MITRVYQVIKRDGRIVSFDISKIAVAIEKAYEAVHDMNLESLMRYSRAFNCPVIALLPAKFRQGLPAMLLDVLVEVAGLPEEKQNKIAAMIKTAIELAA